MAGTRTKLEKGAEKARARAKSPYAVAKAILERMAEPKAFENGELFGGLVHSKTGLSYGYNGRYWEPAEPDTMKRIAYLGDLAATGTAKKARMADIVALLQAESYKHDLEFMRCADHEIPVRNGVVDVLTGEIRPHRMSDWLAGVLPVDFDKRARADFFELALDMWFGEPGGAQPPDDRADALIDFFGYVALPHAKFKQALLCFGEGDTGKSVPLMLARKLVGSEFCTALGVEAMDDPVQRSTIKHKRVNVLTELTTDALIKEGGFKTMVSTEEPLLINPKYEKPHDYVPIAKHMIATNNLPVINDRSAATFNRLLIIPFTKVLKKEEQDRDLLAKMTTPDQMSGLLNLAVKGAARLIARGGQFVAPKAGADLNRSMREDANPMFDFIRARLIKDGADNVRAGELAKEFNEWRQGGKKVDTRAIGKLARAAGLEWGDIWNSVNGGNDKGVIGWRIRIASDAKDGPPPPKPADET